MPEKTAPAPGSTGQHDGEEARTLSAAPADGSGTSARLATLTPLQAMRRLESGPKGLTEEEAEDRLLRYGPNTLPAWQPPSLPRRLLGSLLDPFTSVLLCLGLVSAAIASWGTVGVIFLLVTVSCALRTGGERRADRSMSALRALAADTATVLRRTDDDADRPQTREVPVGELTPGDVVRLGAGDLVPADVLLLRSVGLSVHQSPLTGESAPVGKFPSDVPGIRDADRAAGDPGAGLFEQPQLCFQGSSVATGSGTAVVLATGADTRFADGNRGPQGGRSAFDRSVYGISWILIRFMLLTPPLVLMADAALSGRGVRLLPFAVAVAVSLTPEMLPVVVTTALARCAAVLARRDQVIVRRLPALHDLGAMDVLCLDKTGTLTQDRPVVDSVTDAEGRPAGEVLHWAAVNAMWTLQLAELPAPDALDEAVLEASQQTGLDPLEYDGVAALPFDPVRRLATAVVRSPDRLGMHTLVVKGAVEDVLERCTLDEAQRELLLARAAQQAAGGLRLLAVATAGRPARTRAYSTADERGLAFAGFVAFRDALVPDTADALRTLDDKGVAVRILTGDHPGTAARTCHELGLPPGEVLTGERVESLSDAELAREAGRTVVFARCTPQHKARIVAALRRAGHTTGYLGDGVNDLAALRAADVAVCPRQAVPTAREAADVVLPEKDFAALDRAITAGRHSGGNIAAYLRITLSSNLGNAVAMLAAGLLLPFLPMLPLQVLIQNLFFDAAQLAFAFDRPAPAVVRQPTKLRPREILRFITGFGLLNATADMVTFAVLALAAGHTAGSGEGVFQAGWFTENLLTQALVILLLRTGSRAVPGRMPDPVRLAVGVLAVVGVLLPLTPVGSALGMAVPPVTYYPVLAAVLACYGAALMAARSRYARRHRV